MKNNNRGGLNSMAFNTRLHCIRYNIKFAIKMPLHVKLFFISFFSLVFRRILKYLNVKYSVRIIYLISHKLDV